MALSIEILHESDLWSEIPDIEDLSKNILNYATQFVDIDDALVSLCLSNDVAIKELNKKWRNIDKSTNVLSFPSASSMNFDNIILGDIIISFETVQHECLNENKSFQDHFTHLLIHGFLHLLGYDHIEEDEAIEMEQLERDILAGLNISDPYEGTTIQSDTKHD